METIPVLFETSDVGREIHRAASTVLFYVRTRRLRPAAITPSGRRLFDPVAVAVLRERLSSSSSPGFRRAGAPDRGAR